MPTSPRSETADNDSWGAVVVWLAQDAEKIHRILTKHRDDGSGYCAHCSAWCRDPVPFPCMLRQQAVEARALYLSTIPEQRPAAE